ncbi:hypothetical protein [Dactylosporangium sp. CA-139066]|uniref:hypothetical protein n=1 Tax=Dactylosporangium sp. CA-139066 TaxID=3239930 RepID=UPI003D94EEA6
MSLPRAWPDRLSSAAVRQSSSGKVPGRRHAEAARGGQLGELAEDVGAQLGAGVVAEVEAHPEPAGGGEVADGQYPVGRGDGADELRQRVADRGRVQRAVDEAAGQCRHPLGQAVAVRRDLGARRPQWRSWHGGRATPAADSAPPA